MTPPSIFFPRGPDFLTKHTHDTARKHSSSRHDSMAYRDGSTPKLSDPWKVIANAQSSRTSRTRAQHNGELGLWRSDASRSTANDSLGPRTSSPSKHSHASDVPKTAQSGGSATRRAIPVQPAAMEREAWSPSRFSKKRGYAGFDDSPAITQVQARRDGNWRVTAGTNAKGNEGRLNQSAVQLKHECSICGKWHRGECQAKFCADCDTIHEDQPCPKRRKRPEAGAQRSFETLVEQHPPATSAVQQRSTTFPDMDMRKLSITPTARASKSSTALPAPKGPSVQAALAQLDGGTGSTYPGRSVQELGHTGPAVTLPRAGPAVTKAAKATKAASGLGLPNTANGQVGTTTMSALTSNNPIPAQPKMSKAAKRAANRAAAEAAAAAKRARRLAATAPVTLPAATTTSEELATTSTSFPATTTAPLVQPASTSNAKTQYRNLMKSLRETGSEALRRALQGELEQYFAHETATAGLAGGEGAGQQAIRANAVDGVAVPQQRLPAPQPTVKAAEKQQPVSTKRTRAMERLLAERRSQSPRRSPSPEDDRFYRERSVSVEAPSV